MSTFKAGFARIDITPPLGIEMSGYYETRYSEGVLDPLLATAVVIDDGEKRAAIIALDIICMGNAIYQHAADITSKNNNLDFDSVFITCSHTHTGPVLETLTRNEVPDEPYNEMLCRKISDVVALAIQDLKPVSIRTGTAKAEGISFIRRYRMKDGSAKTNPGVNNPAIDHPIGENDESVQVISMTQECGSDIVLVNFQVHPDIVGGNFYSADYPKFVRDTVENTIHNSRCIYINGAQGDTNHVNVHPAKTKRTFKSMLAGIGEGGYWFAKNVGRTIGGAVLSIYEKLEPLDTGKIAFGKAFAKVPANKGTPEEIKRAREILAKDTNNEFKTDTMDDVTILAEAYRIVRLIEHDDFFTIRISALIFGELGLVCFPGEPFTEIGCKVKSSSELEKCFISCCANGQDGYFPTYDAFEGGYEAKSSEFKPGVGEELIKVANELVCNLKKEV